MDVDANNDGRSDSDADTDSDGWSDPIDGNNGGTVLPVPDLDGDGNQNYLDVDSDNDGIIDNVEGQTTAAYVAPARADTDGDGWDDQYDSDNGGTAIAISDNDGIGNPDYLDSDSDEDGVDDWIEGFDTNKNGDALDDFKARAFIYERDNNAGVYINEYDLDEDGIPDWMEDDDSDGIANFLDVDNGYYRDTDNDGLVDLYDEDNGGVPSNTPDFTGDGEFDFRDNATNTALPIILVSFEANKVGDQVRLTWVTSAEVNNDYFTIEHSFDGVDFYPILTLEGAGNSSRIINYSVIDENPDMGINYYRLKQTDFNGKTQVFGIRTVNFDEDADKIQVFPNPAQQQLFVRLNDLKSGTYQVSLLSQEGKLLKQKDITVSFDNSTYEFEILEGESFARGSYYVKVIGNGEVTAFPIIIEQY